MSGPALIILWSIASGNGQRITGKQRRSRARDRRGSFVAVHDSLPIPFASAGWKSAPNEIVAIPAVGETVIKACGHSAVLRRDERGQPHESSGPRIIRLSVPEAGSSAYPDGNSRNTEGVHVAIACWPVIRSRWYTDSWNEILSKPLTELFALLYLGPDSNVHVLWICLGLHVILGHEPHRSHPARAILNSQGSGSRSG